MSRHILCSAVAAILLGGFWRQALAQDVSGPLTLQDAISAAESQLGILPASLAAAQTSAAVGRSLAGPGLGLSAGMAVMPEEGRSGVIAKSTLLTFDLSPATQIGSRNASRAQVAQAIANIRGARRALLTDVVTAFFAAAKDQTDISSAEETVSLALQSFEAASRRQKVGMAPLVDVERADAALAAAQADLSAARTALVGDNDSLNRLINIGSLERGVSVPALPSTLPESSVATAAILQNDASIAAASASLDAARASLLVARGASIPSLSLGAGVATSTTRTDHTVGPALSITLGMPFRITSAQANVLAADAAEQAAEVTLAQARSNAVQTVLHALTEAQSQLARLPKLQEAFGHAQRVAEAELRGYRLGAVTSADLIAAQSQLATARSALNDSRVSTAQSIAMLELRMGSFER